MFICLYVYIYIVVWRLCKKDVGFIVHNAGAVAWGPWHSACPSIRVLCYSGIVAGWSLNTRGALFAHFCHTLFKACAERFCWWGEAGGVMGVGGGAASLLLLSWLPTLNDFSTDFGEPETQNQNLWYLAQRAKSCKYQCSGKGRNKKQCAECRTEERDALVNNDKQIDINWATRRRSKQQKDPMI